MTIHDDLKLLTGYVSRTKGPGEALRFYVDFIQPIKEYFGGDEEIEKIMVSETAVASKSKLIALIKGISEIPCHVEDTPSGGYTHSCPLCGAYKIAGRWKTTTPSDLEHDKDCLYLLAKELYGNINLQTDGI
jgi:hypothetical protein